MSVCLVVIGQELQTYSVLSWIFHRCCTTINHYGI